MNKQELKAVAIKMVGEAGLINLSRSALCERAGIPDGSFVAVMGRTFSELVEELRKEGVLSPFTQVNKTRTSPELRKENILDTALAVATRVGYQNISRDEVAKAAGISGSLITLYFDNMDGLRRQVMAQAIRHENLYVIAQGLANNDPQALTVAPDIRGKAASVLLGV